MFSVIMLSVVTPLISPLKEGGMWEYIQGLCLYIHKYSLTKNLIPLPNIDLLKGHFHVKFCGANMHSDAFLDGKNLDKFNLTGLDFAEFSTLEVAVS